MTIDPKVSEEARHTIGRRVDKFVARSQRGQAVRGEYILSDLEVIAQDDLRTNLPGARQAYLAEMRLRIDSTVYEELLDGPLYALASSPQLNELAQNVADQASDPDTIDAADLEAKLVAIAQEDLGAGVMAARGAFLAHLEANLPHGDDTYDALLAGPLSFLANPTTDR
jgi:hypothetical protein